MMSISYNCHFISIIV